MRKLIIIFTVLACSLLLIPLVEADTDVDLTVEVVERVGFEDGRGRGDRGRQFGSEVQYKDGDKDEDKEVVPVVPPTTPEPVEPVKPVETMPSTIVPPGVFPWWWIVLGLLMVGLGFVVYKIKRR